MADRSRTANTMRNLKIGMLMQIIGYILSFVNRTVFIQFIGSDYLGVSSLFTNILTILSFTEAGVGSAFVSLLYKPLRDGDTDTVNSIMKAFRRVFTVIAGIVTVAGVALTPIIELFLSEDAAKIENIRVIYLIFLAGSVVNYIFTNRVALIKADQKTYIISVYDEIIAIVQYILQIAAVVAFDSFLGYVIVQVGLNMLRNVLLSEKSKRLYPYLREKAKAFPKELRATVTQRIKGGALEHTGYIINNGTDSIVITAFLGIAVTGLYSNYLMVTSIIGCLLNIVYNSIGASIGDLIAEGDSDKTYRYFRYIIFGGFSLLSVAAVGMTVMFNPFIDLWVGHDYTFDYGIVVLIVVVFLMGTFGLKRPMMLFKNAAGLFYNDRYFALAEGIVNLGLSILLVQYIGFAGVLVDTIASSAITLFSGAYVVHKHLFKRSMWPFFGRLALFAAVTAACTGGLTVIYSAIGGGGWLAFVLEGIGCVAVTGIAIVAVFCRSEELRFAVNFVRSRIVHIKMK